MKDRIFAIIKKEFLQISRDKGTLGVLLVIPFFLLIMFGYAISLDIKHISLAVLDLDRSAESRTLIRSFLNSEYFDLYGFLTNADDADTLLDEEKILAALIIPHNFSHDLSSRDSTSVQIIIDGANGSTASTAIGYMTSIINEFSNKRFQQNMKKNTAVHIKPVIDFRPRVLFNPMLESANFLIPGLMVLILMMTAVMSTALAIVREKELGTMEQISTAPIHPIELIIGKTIPYILISLLSTITILIFGYFLFDVVIKGSYLLLGVITLIFITGCLGLGILISTVAETQQAAFMISVMATLLPTYILSGFVFPIKNMPMIIQVITYILPGRYFLQALRDIMLKGAGIEVCWPEIIGLVIFMAITIIASTLRLRKGTQG